MNKFLRIDFLRVDELLCSSEATFVVLPGL